jgi:hypothetical protein
MQFKPLCHEGVIIVETMEEYKNGWLNKSQNIRFVSCSPWDRMHLTVQQVNNIKLYQ